MDTAMAFGDSCLEGMGRWQLLLDSEEIHTLSSELLVIKENIKILHVEGFPSKRFSCEDARLDLIII
jgi:hypothetical protein